MTCIWSALNGHLDCIKYIKYIYIKKNWRFNENMIKIILSVFYYVNILKSNLVAKQYFHSKGIICFFQSPLVYAVAVDVAEGLYIRSVLPGVLLKSINGPKLL